MTDSWQCMINNFTPQKHVDMSYFLAFGDLNGDWLKKKTKRNTQLSAPFVTLNRREWLSRSANGVLLKFLNLKWFFFQFA